MFWFVVVAGLMNAGLGLMLVLFVSRQRKRQALATAAPVGRGAVGLSAGRSAPAPTIQDESVPSHPSETAYPATDTASTSNSADAAEPCEQIPLAWLEFLGESLHSNLFAEAAAHVVRLDVTRHREELVRIHRVLHAQPDTLDPVVIRQLQFDVLRTNEDWLTRQSETIARLTLRRERGSTVDPTMAALESALAAQATHIRDVCQVIAEHNLSAQPAAGKQQLLWILTGLLDYCHNLRDRTQECLVSVLRREGRLESLKPVLWTDKLTGIPSRARMEMLLEQWWRDDPARQRLASAALFDIDRLGEINATYGPTCADRLIAALARLSNDTFRRNRGYDLVGRFSGQQFLVFLGDTGPQGATTALERLRQTLEAATIRVAGDELPASISCGVTEIYQADTAATLLARVQQTLLAAKSAGGNCTFLHDGERPMEVAAPLFTVALHTMSLDADA